MFLAFLIKYSSEFFDLDAIIDDDDMDMFLLLAVLLFLKSSSSSAREYYRGLGQDYMECSNWRFWEASRFEKTDFDRLVQLLQIPDRFAESGHVLSGPVYFAVTLYSFSYPCNGVLWREYLEKTDHGFRECISFVLIFCMPDRVSKLIWILDSCYHDLLATEEQYLPRQVDL